MDWFPRFGLVAKQPEFKRKFVSLVFQILIYTITKGERAVFEFSAAAVKMRFRLVSIPAMPSAIDR
jgi:hypothetical protein